ncbi:hypothetical protein DID96_32285 [Burkholderia sp. Bp8963]|nr:hypothetical protein DID96_32285 [Burkholderia sp. Bp8963]
MIHNPDGSIVQAPITFWRMGAFFCTRRFDGRRGLAAVRSHRWFRWLASRQPDRSGFRYHVLACWHAGMLACWHAGMLACWRALRIPTAAHTRSSRARSFPPDPPSPS